MWATLLHVLQQDQNLARIEQNPVLFVTERAAEVRGLGTSALVLSRWLRLQGRDEGTMFAVPTEGATEPAECSAAPQGCTTGTSGCFSQRVWFCTHTPALLMDEERRGTNTCLLTRCFSSGMEGEHVPRSLLVLPVEQVTPVPSSRVGVPLRGE